MKFYATKAKLEDYFLASSAEEALAYLMAHDGDAQVIAGGTYLMPLLQTGECRASRLVDVSRIGALKRVSVEGPDLIVGGAVTFGILNKPEVLPARCLLREVADQMGPRSIRRLATLAGNLVSAEGNAGGSVALIALGAEAEITNVTGAQWLPVASLFVQPGLSRVDSTTEIVTAIRARVLHAGEGGAIETLDDSESRERPLVVMAILLALSEDGQQIEWARVVLGIAGGIPRQMTSVEEFLAGAIAEDPQTRQELVRLLVEECEPQLPVDRGVGMRRVAGAARRAYDRALVSARSSQAEL